MAYRTKSINESVEFIPPQSKEAEDQVIGAILKDPEAINKVIEVIQNPNVFYFQKHKIIYNVILDLYDKSEPCDIILVSEKLKQIDELEKIGGRSYLAQLAEDAISTANAGKHANIILNKALLRGLIDTTNEINKKCYVQVEDIDELIDQAEVQIFSLAETRLRKGFVDIKTLTEKTQEELGKMHAGEIELLGVKTGFTVLDELTLGLHKGDLIVVAGRPSMGKTSLAMNIAENIATRDENPLGVGIFSLEMSAEQLVLRMLCGRARVNQQKVRSNDLKDPDWDKIARAGNVFGNTKIFIDDTPSLTVLEMRAKARRLKAQHPDVGLFIVDYMQLMQGHARAENRQQEISTISRSLKALAKELNVPVIAISQLSRQVEQRGGGKRPQLSDLRESGAIEQDSDLVIFVYRHEFYLSDEEKLEVDKKEKFVGKADIIVAKQRNGPTGDVKLAFVKEFARFENLEFRHPELPPEAESYNRISESEENSVDESESPF